MKREVKYALGGALALIAVAGVAFGGAYVADNMGDKTTHNTRIARTSASHYAAMQPAAGQPAPRPCDDHNIVGTLGGGLAGGLIGSRFGGGDGKTVATAAGALGGAALGNAYIPTRGATCN